MAQVKKIKDGKYKVDYRNAQNKRRRKIFAVKADADLFLNKKLADLINNLGVNTVIMKPAIISPKLILGRLAILIRLVVTSGRSLHIVT